MVHIMESSNLTAREIYQQLKANPTRARFGFGTKAILVNVDPQKPIPEPTSLKQPTKLTPDNLSTSIR